MQYLKAKLVKELLDFFSNDHRRIEHALDVLHHAENILSDRKDCDIDIKELMKGLRNYYESESYSLCYVRYRI